MKIGAAGFIVPFMFVYEPALLMIGDWPWIIWRFLAACVGIMLFAAGLHGYFITYANLWQRALLVVGGLLLVAPHPLSDVAGGVLAAIVAAAQIIGRRNEAAARPVSDSAPLV